VRGRWLRIVISANLAVLVALAFVYPHLMVAPGALSQGHAALATDCFRCHAPLRGASTERCMACHAVPDIGIRTTLGARVQTAATGHATPMKLSFHQELDQQNCMACHSDHASPRLTQHRRKPFSHALLRAASRESCASCHAAPNNALHRNLAVGCAQCHASGAWKPASFEHDKLFLLDKDHNVACATCHVGRDQGQYTCYGCHEHTPANVSRKHAKEGIQNFENCVECHRSADDEPGRSSGREGKGSRKGGKRD
jgi:hypothetical protein